VKTLHRSPPHLLFHPTATAYVCVTIPQASIVNVCTSSYDLKITVTGSRGYLLPHRKRRRISVILDGKVWR